LGKEWACADVIHRCAGIANLNSFWHKNLRLFRELAFEEWLFEFFINFYDYRRKNRLCGPGLTKPFLEPCRISSFRGF